MMFSNLTERLSRAFKNLRGQGRLTKANIEEVMKDVHTALLEADVALSVVKTFIGDVSEKALGQEVMLSLRPGEAFIKIVHDELVKVLGEVTDPLNLQSQLPAVILMAGLQGSGKTTTTAKLARWIQENLKKTVLLVSTDIYRPAAIKQLETLASQVNASYFPSDSDQDPLTIAKGALQKAKTQFIDVVIIDTAGRLHIDQAMMGEIHRLHQATQPIETLFVVDSMTGQDAVNAAKAFHDVLPLTGIILTKTDGDARGGAALSLRTITGKPIKFIGTGEKMEGLEVFHPDRIASRILDMGDILTLVEEVQRKVDHRHAKKMEEKLKKGGFDLEDFRSQLQQMKNMGDMTSLLSKLPGAGQIQQALKGNFDNKIIIKMEAIINSMTPKERRFPAIIKGSHKRRIAQGSGTEIQDVNRLLKQFLQMQKMMKKLKGQGMMKMLSRMKGLMPPHL